MGRETVIERKHIIIEEKLGGEGGDFTKRGER